MNSFSIEPYRHDLEMIRDTVVQIKKDFSMFDFEINFSGDEKTAYHEYFIMIFFIDTGSIITHRKKPVIIVFFAGNFNFYNCFVGKLNSVFNQVKKHLS